MWTRFKDPLAAEVVDKIRKRAHPLENIEDEKRFLKQGKNFFFTLEGFKELRAIAQHIESQLPLGEKFKKPAIHHAFLLYKAPHGPETEAHQDRAYWGHIEKEVSMMTAWLALDDIGIEFGCLKLDPDEFTPPENLKELNAPREILPHVKDSLGYFVDREAHLEDILLKMKPMPVKKGEMLLFDALQVHASERNQLPKTRCALKVVLGEAGQVNDHLVTFDDLKKNRWLRFYFKKVLPQKRRLRGKKKRKK